MRRCPVPGCGAEVRPHQLMDPRHWNLLPFGTQVTVVFLWNSGRTREGYAEACASAVDMVVETIEGRAQWTRAPYGRVR